MRRSGWRRAATSRAAIAVAFGCVTAALAYAFAHVAQTRLYPQANPAAIVWSAKSEVAWRAAIALYAAGLGALGGLALAGSSPATCTRWLARLVPIAAAAVAIAGAVAP
jgi:hypothetical protein